MTNPEVATVGPETKIPNPMERVKHLSARLLLSLSLSLGTGFAGAVVSETATADERPALAESPTDCGATILSGKDWLQGQGVDVHYNGSSQGTGSSCKGDSETYNLNANPPQFGFGWQCVELINRLYASKGWYPQMTLGPETNYGAKWLYSYAKNGKYPGLVAKENGSGYIPVPGDLIIDSNDDYGHVAVVDFVENKTIKSVEQNGSRTGRMDYGFNPDTGTASQPGFTVLGYIHAEKNTFTGGGGTGRKLGDYNGDGAVEAGVFRPNTGGWHVRGAGIDVPYGRAGDIPVPGFYNSDLKTDVAVFRPSSGMWHIRGIGDVPYGQNGDIPVPADYDGDGLTDIAVYRPSTGQWFIRNQGAAAYGQTGDIPVPGLYDKDGKADIAVYRPSNGEWHVRGVASAVYGRQGHIPVPADYDGDGMENIGVYRPSTGEWHIRGLFSVAYGNTTDIPVPADFNGDKKADIGIFRPSAGEWHIRNIGSMAYGQSGDLPVTTMLNRAVLQRLNLTT